MGAMQDDTHTNLRELLAQYVADSKKSDENRKLASELLASMDAPTDPPEGPGGN